MLKNRRGQTLRIEATRWQQSSFAGTGKGTIRSAQPATLYIDAQVAPEYTPDNENWLTYERMTFNGAFEGAVSVSVEGLGTFLYLR